MRGAIGHDPHRESMSNRGIIRWQKQWRAVKLPARQLVPAFMHKKKFSASEATPASPAGAAAESLPDGTPPPNEEPFAEAIAAPAGGDALARAEAEAAQWKETALRARADLENFRKRMAQESAEARKFANAALIESLLPILDNFQFGLEAARNDAAARNLVVGLNMVAAQLQNFLREQGVEELDVVGQRFDPNLHDAVAQEPSTDVDEGRIISQVRRGFRLRDRLLRPASVVVSTGAPKSVAAM
jgi:molecular chaperone GrpE